MKSLNAKPKKVTLNLDTPYHDALSVYAAQHHMTVPSVLKKLIFENVFNDEERKEYLEEKRRYVLEDEDTF